MSLKYTVSFRAPFSSQWSKAQHASLPAALESAWRKHRKEYSMGDITYEQKPVFTSDELSEALTEMDNLAREGQKVQPHELAERVIQVMGK